MQRNRKLASIGNVFLASLLILVALIRAEPIHSEENQKTIPCLISLGNGQKLRKNMLSPDRYIFLDNPAWSNPNSIQLTVYKKVTRSFGNYTRIDDGGKCYFMQNWKFFTKKGSIVEAHQALGYGDSRLWLEFEDGTKYALPMIYQTCEGHCSEYKFLKTKCSEQLNDNQLVSSVVFRPDDPFEGQPPSFLPQPDIIPEKHNPKFTLLDVYENENGYVGRLEVNLGILAVTDYMHLSAIRLKWQTVVAFNDVLEKTTLTTISGMKYLKEKSPPGWYLMTLMIIEEEKNKSYLLKYSFGRADITSR